MGLGLHNLMGLHNSSVAFSVSQSSTKGEALINLSFYADLDGTENIVVKKILKSGLIDAISTRIDGSLFHP